MAFCFYRFLAPLEMLCKLIRELIQRFRIFMWLSPQNRISLALTFCSYYFLISHIWRNVLFDMQSEGPAWAPLRDNYMLTNSKLKDWDKMPVWNSRSLSVSICYRSFFFFFFLPYYSVDFWIYVILLF